MTGETLAAARTTMVSTPTHPDILLSRATLADAPAIQALVATAYTKYIPRIGRPPAPMSTDYAALITSSAAAEEVHVLRATGPSQSPPLPEEAAGVVVGAIVLADHPADDAIQVHNLVVGPAAQGRGYGRVLMGLAEAAARQQGRGAITLFTNEKMVENLGMYPKMGFVEVDRRVEDGFNRVYFRKNLALEANE